MPIALGILAILGIGVTGAVVKPITDDISKTAGYAVIGGALFLSYLVIKAK
jgi:hypothetical protein